jgi:hypothetical protein
MLEKKHVRYVVVLENVLGAMVVDGQFGNYRNAAIVAVLGNAQIVMALEKYEYE